MNKSFSILTIEYATPGGKIVNDNRTYFLADHIGSTRLTIDDNQNVISTAIYDAYGNTLQTYSAQGAAFDENFAFAGDYRYYKDDTGLTYLKNRYYDSEVGRFISRDPIGYLGGLNLYNYVNGNPVNGVDPEGLFYCFKNMRLWAIGFISIPAIAYVIHELLKPEEVLEEAAKSIAPIPAGHVCDGSEGNTNYNVELCIQITMAECMQRNPTLCKNRHQELEDSFNERGIDEGNWNSKHRELGQEIWNKFILPL